MILHMWSKLINNDPEREIEVLFGLTAACPATCIRLSPMHLSTSPSRYLRVNAVRMNLRLRTINALTLTALEYNIFCIDIGLNDKGLSDSSLGIRQYLDSDEELTNLHNLRGGTLLLE